MERNLELNRLKFMIKYYSVLFEPEIILPVCVKSTQDIYINRTVLKNLQCNDDTVFYIANIILDALLNRRKFRKTDCIKVLRSIIRNTETGFKFKPTTVRILFQIYKYLINTISEEGQWATSILIKNQLLVDEEIQWLMQNCQSNIHPLNRLLLYPEYNPLISKWAEKVYLANDFPEREIEIIALCIKNDIPAFIDIAQMDKIIEAVVRARIPYDNKENMLIKMLDQENYERLLNVAIKYHMKNLFENLRFAIEKSI